ncbi:hypothetical protein V8E52_010175 [Russula decolorans]
MSVREQTNNKKSSVSKPLFVNGGKGRVRNQNESMRGGRSRREWAKNQTGPGQHERIDGSQTKYCTTLHARTHNDLISSHSDPYPPPPTATFPSFTALPGLCLPGPDLPGAGTKSTNPVPIQTNTQFYIRLLCGTRWSSETKEDAAMLEHDQMLPTKYNQEHCRRSTLTGIRTTPIQEVCNLGSAASARSEDVYDVAKGRAKQAAASTMPASALADNAITAQGTLSGDPTHHESECACPLAHVDFKRFWVITAREVRPEQSRDNRSELVKRYGHLGHIVWKVGFPMGTGTIQLWSVDNLNPFKNIVVLLLHSCMFGRT